MQEGPGQAGRDDGGEGTDELQVFIGAICHMDIGAFKEIYPTISCACEGAATNMIQCDLERTHGSYTAIATLLKKKATAKGDQDPKQLKFARALKVLLIHLNGNTDAISGVQLMSGLPWQQVHSL